MAGTATVLTIVLLTELGRCQYQHNITSLMLKNIYQSYYLRPAQAQSRQLILTNAAQHMFTACRRDGNTRGVSPCSAIHCLIFSRLSTKVTLEQAGGGGG